MTRAEFNKIAAQYFKSCGVPEGASVMDWAMRNGHQPMVIAIADVATNGFDAEPLNITGSLLIRQPSSWTAIEQAQEAAKRSRPFVGSHKLPYDSDYD